MSIAVCPECQSLIDTDYVSMEEHFADVHEEELSVRDSLIIKNLIK